MRNKLSPNQLNNFPVCFLRKNLTLRFSLCFWLNNGMLFSDTMVGQPSCCVWTCVGGHGRCEGAWIARNQQVRYSQAALSNCGLWWAALGRLTSRSIAQGSGLGLLPRTSFFSFCGYNLLGKGYLNLQPASRLFLSKEILWDLVLFHGCNIVAGKTVQYSYGKLK